MAHAQSPEIIIITHQKLGLHALMSTLLVEFIAPRMSGSRQAAEDISNTTIGRVLCDILIARSLGPQVFELEGV